VHTQHEGTRGVTLLRLALSTTPVRRWWFLGHNKSIRNKASGIRGKWSCCKFENPRPRWFCSVSDCGSNDAGGVGSGFGLFVRWIDGACGQYGSRTLCGADAPCLPISDWRRTPSHGRTGAAGPQVPVRGAHRGRRIRGNPQPGGTPVVNHRRTQ